MINVGLVGLGFMSATHIRAYRQISGVRVAAVCSPSGRNLDGDLSKVAGNLGEADPVILDMSEIKAYRDFGDLLADSTIDLIDICTPTHSHHSLAIEALKSGKHVVCEKPLARTSKLAAEIAEATKESKGFLLPAMCLRFWPGWAWLKQVIDEARYGKVLSANFRRMAEPPAWGQKNFFDGKQSGGALLDLHIHDTDFVQFCFGKPRSVFSSGYTKFSGAIDHVVTQYDVASGAIVSAEGGWAMSKGFGFSMSYSVNFERATVEFNLARGDEALQVCEEGDSFKVQKLEGTDGFVGELTHMVEAIRSGTPPSVVTAEDAVSAVEICEAEEKSVATREVVRLAG